jgi:uncharacterized membrane protein YfcA
MPELLRLTGIVILFGTVQSIFGVGLLLFGTPTLLLLGYPFEQVLALLLPCSIVVNLLQVSTSWKFVTLQRDFINFCLPAVAVGLIVSLSLTQKLNFKIVIGLLLLITAILRSSNIFKYKLEVLFRKLTKISLFIIGAVHGLTNMGGGLLTIFISSLYRENQTLRANIAFGYLLMATCQIAVLIALRTEIFDLRILVLVTTASATYLLIGNRIFQMTSKATYQYLITALIVIFGVLMLT